MTGFREGQSPAECRELDRRTICDYGVPGIVLMEHAAIGASALCLQALEESGVAASTARVVVACGPGNNGGDGYAIARHLSNARCSVHVYELVREDQIDASSDAGINRAILSRWRLPITNVADQFAPLPTDADLLVDAIFGTGLSRAATGVFEQTIAALNEHGAPVVAIDVPSGLDADSGEPLGETVEARWTATFGLIKRGFLAPPAARFTGAIFCVPIGIPKELLPTDAPAFPPAPVPFDGGS